MEDNKNNLETNKDRIKFYLTRISIASFIIILVFAIYGFIHFTQSFIEENYDDEDEDYIEDDTEYNYDDELLKYELNVYIDDDNNYCYYKGETENCNTSVFSIKTETEDAEIISFSNDAIYGNTSFILYRDNVLKLYNVWNHKIINLALEDDYDDYQIILNNTQVIGLVYTSNGTDSYFDITNNKKMYENKYETINSSINILGTIYLQVNDNKNGKTILLNTNTEKEELIYNEIVDFEVKEYNNKYLLIGIKDNYNKDTSCIYPNINSEPLYKNKELVKDLDYVIYKDNLYINDNYNIKKFDFNGNLITNKEINKNNFEQIINNYIIYKDKKLKLYNMDTKKEISITDWNDNYYYSKTNSNDTLAITNYYDKSSLDTLNAFSNTTFKDTGLYIVIGFKRRDSKNNYGTIYYLNKNNVIKTYNINKNPYNQLYYYDENNYSYKVKDYVEPKNSLDVYKYKDSDKYCDDKYEDCPILAHSIKTESKNPYIISFDNYYSKTSFILYNDNGLKIYNIKTKEITKINLESTYESYSFIVKDNKAKGILYYNKEYNYETKNYEGIGYFNIETNKKMYDNKYSYIEDIYNGDDQNYLQAFIINKDTKEEQMILLNIDKEEEIIKTDVMKESCSMGGMPTRNFIIKKHNNSKLYIVYDGCGAGDDWTERIYSNNKKLILSSDIIIYSIKDNYLYANDNNVIKKFDFNGNIITKKSFTKDSVKSIINNYALYIENNYLQLYNIDKDESLKIVEWNANNYYIPNGLTFIPSSGYYTNLYHNLETLNSLTTSNLTKEGIYINVGFKEKDSNGYNGLIYYFDEDNNKFIKYNVDKLNYN